MRTFIFFFSVLLTISFQSSGQQKIKPPKLSAYIGTVKDSATRNLSDASALLGQPLKIVDDKQNIYTVSSYQFLYRKNIAIENEEGKVSHSTSLQSQRFRESPLPAIWVKSIREELQPGELLYFFDIIVKDKSGRVMYAPDIKITVK